MGRKCNLFLCEFLTNNSCIKHYHKYYIVSKLVPENIRTSPREDQFEPLPPPPQEFPIPFVGGIIYADFLELHIYTIMYNDSFDVICNLLNFGLFFPMKGNHM